MKRCRELAGPFGLRGQFTPAFCNVQELLARFRIFGPCSRFFRFERLGPVISRALAAPNHSVLFAVHPRLSVDVAARAGCSGKLLSDRSGIGSAVLGKHLT